MSPYRRRIPSEAVAALERLAAHLVVYRAESQRLADDFAASVRECIEAGATWGEVGRQIGISKQAARAHWVRYLNQDESAPHWGPYLRDDGSASGDLRSIWK